MKQKNLLKVYESFFSDQIPEKDSSSGETLRKEIEFTGADYKKDENCLYFEGTFELSKDVAERSCDKEFERCSVKEGYGFYPIFIFNSTAIQGVFSEIAIAGKDKTYYITQARKYFPYITVNGEPYDFTAGSGGRAQRLFKWGMIYAPANTAGTPVEISYAMKFPYSPVSLKSKLAGNFEIEKSLYEGCISMTEVKRLSFPDTVESLGLTFADCTKLAAVKNIDTAGVTDFYKCFFNTNIRVFPAGMDFSKAQNVKAMFEESELEALPEVIDFSSISDPKNIARIFYSCMNLKVEKVKIYISCNIQQEEIFPVNSYFVKKTIENGKKVYIFKKA